MNLSRPVPFWTMMGAIALVAALVIVGTLMSVPDSAAMAVVLFMVAAMLTEAVPSRIHSEVAVTLTVVVLFTAIPYLGLAGGVAAGLGAGVVAGIGSTGNRVVKGLFNVAMLVLSATAAGLTFAVITGVGLWPASSSMAMDHPALLTAGLLAAGLAYWLVNTVLMAAIVHLTAGLPFSQTLVQLGREILVLQFLYVGLAAIAYTLLVMVGGASLVLLVVPLIVARRALQSVERRQEAFDRMVRSFVKAIEVKDGYTRGHAERVSHLSVLVAERMGLTYEQRQLIRYGAILHDVGKIGVSLGILCKAGPLTDGEFDEMKLHPEIGAEMLADIDFLKPALAIVEHHHERIDGRGYPAGLSGDDIPLLTRVVTSVDAFDAMTSTRPYRRALPVDVALEELRVNAGTQFDPEVVEHLLAVIDEIGWEVTDEPVTAIRGRHSHDEVRP